ncbi:hypothetical protein Taro_041923 [Colocasia esculenta]|uniref:Uncharacterized protein n=1 Tax=Colocasia esculenta TaxID=4460 RepID=A0A843WFL2_COLES|nr:hypothetical protein [Colocasia esculenta]
MAGKAAAVAAATAAKTVVKAVGEYQYPWREKLAKYKDELSKGVWGYWELGAWKPLSLSARQRARLRKEVLLAGEEWPYDPPRKEMRTKRKGHKCDLVSAEKRANITKLMKKMPQMLLDYKLALAICLPVQRAATMSIVHGWCFPSGGDDFVSSILYEVFFSFVKGSHFLLEGFLSDLSVGALQPFRGPIRQSSVVSSDQLSLVVGVVLHLSRPWFLLEAFYPPPFLSVSLTLGDRVVRGCGFPHHEAASDDWHLLMALYVTGDVSSVVGVRPLRGALALPCIKRRWEKKMKEEEAEKD